jgi:hypothetical protein
MKRTSELLLSKERRWNRILDWWFAPMDVLPLRIFETLLCCSMLYYFSGYLNTPEWWLTHKGFHVSAAATSSHYLSPPPLPPVEWLLPITVAFYATALVYLLGIGRRVLNWLFFGVCVYIQAMDQPSAFTINRMFIVSFFFLGLQPPVEIHEGKKVISGWVIRIFQLTLIIQYVGAGVCKFAWGDWLYRSDVVWTQSQGHYKNQLAAWAVNDLSMFWWYGLAWVSLAFESFAAILFAWNRTRLFAVFFGICFHLGIAMLMKDLIYFSLQMITAYVFFIEPTMLREIRNKCMLVFSKRG